MTGKNLAPVTLAEAIDHVAAIVAALSIPHEVTGAHWQVDLDVPEELEPIRTRVIVYTIDGCRYEVTRKSGGPLQSVCGSEPFTKSPEWERGYESGFADGVNDGTREQSESTAELISAARDALADAEGYGRTHGAGRAAHDRIRARCDRLRAAITAAALS